MNEETKVPPEGNGTTGSPASDNWQEVGRQFQALGESLAQAVRTAWQNEETQRRVAEMRTGLESMAKEVGAAIEDTANTPQGQQIRREAERTADSLRKATEQTVQEVRPQIIDALQQLNLELQKLVNRMESKDVPPAASKPTEPPEGPRQDL